MKTKHASRIRYGIYVGLTVSGLINLGGSGGELAVTVYQTSMSGQPRLVVKAFNHTMKKNHPEWSGRGY